MNETNCDRAEEKLPPSRHSVAVQMAEQGCLLASKALPLEPVYVDRNGDLRPLADWESDDSAPDNHP